jgi:hypothetical protein
LHRFDRWRALVAVYTKQIRAYAQRSNNDHCDAGKNQERAHALCDGADGARDNAGTFIRSLVAKRSVGGLSGATGRGDKIRLWTRFGDGGSSRPQQGLRSCNPLSR